MSQENRMKFKLYIEVEKVSGPDCDEDTVIDAICGSLDGSFRFHAWADGVEADEDTKTIYVVKSADDRESI